MIECLNPNCITTTKNAKYCSRSCSSRTKSTHENTIRNLIPGNPKANARKIEEHQGKLAAYLLTPNLCLYCKEPILPTKQQRLSEVSKKKFCNRNCAAKHNLLGKPSHNKNHNNHRNHYPSLCLYCDSQVPKATNRKYCSEGCLKQALFDNSTLSI